MHPTAVDTRVSPTHRRHDGRLQDANAWTIDRDCQLPWFGPLPVMGVMVMAGRHGMPKYGCSVMRVEGDSKLEGYRHELYLLLYLLVTCGLGLGLEAR